MGSRNITKAASKHGPAHQTDSASVGNGTFRESQPHTTHGNGEATGLTSPVVPTLEEKIILEQSPAKVNGIPIGNDQDAKVQEQNGSYGDDHTENGQALVAPVGPSGSPEKGTALSLKQSGQNDVDDEEQKVMRTRSVLRKHLAAKSPWELPTPRPKVDVRGFDDPVCDAFWKDVWVASAIHNVGL